MDIELLFRTIVLGVFVSSLAISAYYRRRARASGEVIARRAEGLGVLILRGSLALPLLLSILLYVFVPRWMAWAAMPMPSWIRWMGAGLGLLCLPLLQWVFASIGENISETVLTKRSHQLVKEGPYRWVRHPLYGTALVEILAIGMMAQSGFIVALGVSAGFIFRFVVIPVEEKHLIETFGAEYEDYRTRTGALMPRMWR